MRVFLSAQGEAPVTAAALALDGQHVLLGSQQGLEVRTWPDLKVTARLPTKLEQIHDLRFAPDGRTLLAAGGVPAEQGTVEVWSWPEGTLVRRVTGHDDVVYRVAWSPDGLEWATASGDGACQVVSARDGQRLTRYVGHSRAVLAIAYLPDGRNLVSAGVDQTLRLWESTEGKHLRTLDNHVDSVSGIAVRPGVVPPSPPIVVTISDDRTARLWQPTMGRMMRFARLPSAPRSVAWLPDGTRLLVGCNDGRIRLVDPDSAEIVKTFEGLEGRIHELVVDPKRSRWLIGGEGGSRAGSAFP